MIAKLEDSSQFEEFDTGFAKYIEERKEELSSANTNVKEEFKEFETNVEAIINSMETYKDSEEIGTVKDFKNWMAKRLGGGKDGITLTTAHKSKGLEFDRVYDIAPSLYGSSPMLEKAYHKMEQIDRKVQAFEKMRPEGERTPEQEQELKKLKKKAKNYRLRYEGDASQENHAEYVVGTRGRHEHHALDDTKEEDDENL
jgi:superfamily I DNA/RNA helicase